MLTKALKMRVKTIVLYLLIRQQSADNAEICLLRSIVRSVAIRILFVCACRVCAFFFQFNYLIFLSFYVFFFFFFFFFLVLGGGGNSSGTVVFIHAAAATKEMFFHPSFQSLNTTSWLKRQNRELTDIGSS